MAYLKSLKALANISVLSIVKQQVPSIVWVVACYVYILMPIQVKHLAVGNLLFLKMFWHVLNMSHGSTLLYKNKATVGMLVVHTTNSCFL